MLPMIFDLIASDLYISLYGEVPEWSNGLDSKSSELRKWFRGFESLLLRQRKRLVARRAFFFGEVEHMPCYNHISKHQHL